MEQVTGLEPPLEPRLLLDYGKFMDSPTLSRLPVHQFRIDTEFCTKPEVQGGLVLEPDADGAEVWLVREVTSSTTFPVIPLSFTMSCGITSLPLMGA